MLRQVRRDELRSQELLRVLLELVSVLEELQLKLLEASLEK